MICDVAVVGAGPAGCVAAERLARGGARVVLIERATPPRYKTCGGGIVERAARHFPVDIRPVVERDCHRVTLHLSGTGLSLTCAADTPLVRMTMRAALDARLAAAAAEAGARLLPRSHVRTVQFTDGVVVLETDHAPVTARFVVAADGATGIVRRAAGWRPHNAVAPALECELVVSDAVLARFADEARFDFGFVPHGYAWVFPKRRHLSVGLLTTRRGPADLRGALRRYLAHVGIATTERAERHGYVIPLRPAASPLVRHRTVLVGDSCGLADPLTGEGISFAALSGVLAAEAILAGGGDEEAIRARYEGALRCHILSELRAVRPLADILYHRPRLARAIFRLAGRQLAEAVAAVMAGVTSYRAALASPATYLRRVARAASDWQR